MTSNNMISIQVNEKKLIQNVGQTFSNHSTVISELMQNARRAKATEVRLYTSDKNNNLIVVDNGEGVKDFSKLLHVADSGWDVETIKEDKPFGMGFLSCLFAAETVIVESNGYIVEINSQKAINQEPVEVKETGITIAGAKITLKDMKSPEGIEKLLEAKLTHLAAAFPIKVFWNDVEIERPYALKALKNVHNVDGISVSLGENFFEDSHFISYSFHEVYAYYQGLPIYNSARTDTGYPSNFAVILHLTGDQFIPRMPDRDKLFDEESHRKTFSAVVKEIVRKELLDMKSKSTPEEMMKHWRISKLYQCRDIFNDIPLLPEEILSIPRAVPIMEQDFHSEQQNLTDFESNLERESVESGEVKLFVYEKFNTEEHTGAPWVLGNALNWVAVSETLHPDHWAAPHVRGFDHNYEENNARLLQLEIEPVAVIAEEVLTSGYIHRDIKLIVCDHYIVSTTNGEFSREIYLHATSGFVNGELCLVVPRGELQPGDAIEQICDFSSEWEFYSDDRDDEQSTLDTLVAALRGGDPADTLQKVVQDGKIFAYPTLAGKSFTVTVLQGGKVSIQVQDPVAGEQGANTSS